VYCKKIIKGGVPKTRVLSSGLLSYGGNKRGDQGGDGLRKNKHGPLGVEEDTEGEENRSCFESER